MSAPPTKADRDTAVFNVLDIEGEAATYRVSWRADVDFGLTHTCGTRMACHLADMRRRGLVASHRSRGINGACTVYWMRS